MQWLTAHGIPGSVWPIIVFSASLEGSVIKMKPAAPVPKGNSKPKSLAS